MQKVKLDLFSRNICEQNWGKSLTRKIKSSVITSQICYGDKAYTSKDTCRGDSGGPIQVKVGYRRYAIVGVTSLGHPICGSGPPGGYSSVVYYVPWILSYIKKAY